MGKLQDTTWTALLSNAIERDGWCGDSWKKLSRGESHELFVAACWTFDFVYRKCCSTDESHHDVILSVCLVELYWLRNQCDAWDVNSLLTKTFSDDSRRHATGTQNSLNLSASEAERVIKDRHQLPSGIAHENEWLISNCNVLMNFWVTNNPQPSIIFSLITIISKPLIGSSSISPLELQLKSWTLHFTRKTFYGDPFSWFMPIESRNLFRVPFDWSLWISEIKLMLFVGLLIGR